MSRGDSGGEQVFGKDRSFRVQRTWAFTLREMENLSKQKYKTSEQTVTQHECQCLRSDQLLKLFGQNKSTTAFIEHPLGADA